MANGQSGGQKQLVDKSEHTLSRKLHPLSDRLSLYMCRQPDDHWSHLETSSANSRWAGCPSPLSPLHASHTIDSVPLENFSRGQATTYSLQHVMLLGAPSAVAYVFPPSLCVP